MIECPVCGKWLKTPFALSGHIRLKEDKLHQAYFEIHKKQKQTKNTTDIENQLQELISLVKNQNQHFSQQNEDILLGLNYIVELLKKPNTQLSIPSEQEKKNKEIPEKKEKKFKTYEEVINKYGSFKNALKYLNLIDIQLIIDSDPDLIFSARSKLKEDLYIIWRNSE